MGKLTTAAGKLMAEVASGQQKLDVLTSENDKLQSMQTSYNTSLKKLIDTVRKDPKFKDKKAQDVEIDKRTDAEWNKLEAQLFTARLAAQAWQKVINTLPDALKAVKVILATYDIKGKDSKAKKAADAQKLVDLAEGLISTLVKDYKFLKDMY